MSADETSQAKKSFLKRAGSLAAAGLLSLATVFAPYFPGRQERTEKPRDKIDTVYSDNTLRTLFNDPTNRQDLSGQRAGEAARQAKLDSLKDALLLSFTNSCLGWEMICFAQQHDVEIEIDTTLQARGQAGAYSYFMNTAYISPREDLPEQEKTVAHELRHAWQYILRDQSSLNSAATTIAQQWTVNWFVEVDAPAFEKYYADLRDGKLEPAEMTPGRYLREYLEPFFHATRDTASNHNLYTFYADRFFSPREAAEVKLRTSLHQAFASGNEQDFSAAVSALEDCGRKKPANITKALRRLGSYSLDTSAVTPLANPAVSAYQLTVVYPGLRPGDDAAKRIARIENYRQETKRQATMMTGLFKARGSIVQPAGVRADPLVRIIYAAGTAREGVTIRTFILPEAFLQNAFASVSTTIKKPAATTPMDAWVEEKRRRRETRQDRRHVPRKHA